VAVFTDLHLSPAQPEEIHAFAMSLLDLPTDTEAIVILGDLFDAYVGPEDLAHPYFQVLWEAVAWWRQRQAEVFLIRGNRDVLLTAKDGRRVGLEVLDSLVIHGPNLACLLTHGDAFCRADLPYQRLRRLLRNPLLRPLLRALPLRLRYRLAARLRRHSTLEVARKPLDMMALDRATIVAEGQRQGVSRVVIGHLHQAVEEEIGPELRLTILPAWEPGRRAFAPAISSA